jgi:ABC-type dipeptide/oligopeptide/nickel transport system ATPase component
MGQSLLSIENLNISVGRHSRKKYLVKDVSLAVPQERIVALVGGSGSGKTTTGLSIMRLLAPALRIESGKMFFGPKKKDLAACSDHDMRRVRGKKIGMVFQEPLNAFNPVFRIGQQIEEVLYYHTSLNKSQRWHRVYDLLDTVGLPDPKTTALSYPHQLSGGMRQRAMIAQAIAADPSLIIADEPTSNLDVTLQAKIIDLFQRLRGELKLSLLLITHDLGVVRHLSDHIYVMTQGTIVEDGAPQAILGSPGHPYTQELLEALI